MRPLTRYKLLGRYVHAHTYVYTYNPDIDDELKPSRPIAAVERRKRARERERESRVWRGNTPPKPPVTDKGKKNASRTMGAMRNIEKGMTQTSCKELTNASEVPRRDANEGDIQKGEKWSQIRWNQLCVKRKRKKQRGRGRTPPRR